MSQVIISNIKSALGLVEVVGGWDEPLMGHHFTIYQTVNGEEAVLYENLEDPTLKRHWPMDNDHFREVARLFQIDLPEHFWQACDLQAGNLILIWDEARQEYHVRRV